MLTLSLRLEPAFWGPEQGSLGVSPGGPLPEDLTHLAGILLASPWVVAANTTCCTGALLSWMSLLALGTPEGTCLPFLLSTEKSLEQELATPILDIEDLVKSGSKHK